MNKVFIYLSVYVRKHVIVSQFTIKMLKDMYKGELTPSSDFFQLTIETKHMR